MASPNQPEGTHPQGPQPEGTHPQGPQPEGPQPEGPQPEGTHPQGPRPEEPRPEEPQPQGASLQENQQGNQRSHPLERLVNEFINQRVMRWKSRQFLIPNRELAAALAGHAGSYRALPRGQQGCLLPDAGGGYTFIPYNDDMTGLPPRILNRVNMLNAWTRLPQAAPIMVQVDKLLEAEVNKKCWFDFLYGGDASEVDFDGKIRMLAMVAICQGGLGVDMSPHNPTNLQFRFALTDVSDTGKVSMKWNCVDWHSTAQTVVDCMDAFSRPTYLPHNLLPRQVRELGCIHHPEDALTEARALSAELLAQPPIIMNDPRLSYFLCTTAVTEGDRRMEDREWTPLTCLNAIRKMKRLARQHNKWPVIMRPWQLRHYKNQLKISELQQRQEQYCAALEAAQKKA